jgi:AcrR family transcriptional regulator
MKNMDKRTEIMQAALKLIAEHGFHGAPMAMIADTAGVGTGTIYCHFEGKDALIKELFLELREEILKVLLEGYSVDKPIRERFMHLSTVLLKYLIEHSLHFRFIEQYFNSPYGVTWRRERFLRESSDDLDVFEVLFEQAVAQQVIKDFPIPVHFALAFGPLIALVRDHVLGFVTLDDAMIMKFIESCWDGIKR